MIPFEVKGRDVEDLLPSSSSSSSPSSSSSSPSSSSSDSPDCESPQMLL